MKDYTKDLGQLAFSRLGQSKCFHMEQVYLSLAEGQTLAKVGVDSLVGLEVDLLVWRVAGRRRDARRDMASIIVCVPLDEIRSECGDPTVTTGSPGEDRFGHTASVNQRKSSG